MQSARKGLQEHSVCETMHEKHVQHGLEESKLSKKISTALSIPMWSPTIVLTEPLPTCLRRSDGIRNFLVCMAVAGKKN